MKVVMIETGGFGGIGHYAYNLCLSLARQSVDVVLATAADYELADYEIPFELRTVFPAGGTRASALAELRRLLREEEPDLIHFQSIWSPRRDWFSLLRLRHGWPPIVLTAHNVLPHDESERNAFGIRFAYRQLYRVCDAIVVHSQDSRQRMAAELGVPDSKLFVIPHGNYAFLVDAEPTSREAARAKLQLEPDALPVLCFGTIREYKGLQHLIPAFAKVVAQVPAARLIIAGKPVDVDCAYYEQLIAQHGIAEVTQFRPDYVPMDDVSLYFAAAEVVALPYLNIYQSGALHLAFAAGRPVVATEVGAFPETVEEGQSGYLVPPADSEALAQALVRLLELPSDAREAMGQHAKHVAETKYNWDAVAEKTSAMYEGVAGGS